MFAVLDASFDTYTRSVGGCVLSRPVGERVVRRHAQRGPFDATGAELLAVGLLAGRAVPSGDVAGGKKTLMRFLYAWDYFGYLPEFFSVSEKRIIHGGEK